MFSNINATKCGLIFETVSDVFFKKNFWPKSLEVTDLFNIINEYFPLSIKSFNYFTNPYENPLFWTHTWGE